MQLLLCGKYGDHGFSGSNLYNPEFPSSYAVDTCVPYYYYVLYYGSLDTLRW